MRSFAYLMAAGLMALPSVAAAQTATGALTLNLAQHEEEGMTFAAIGFDGIVNAKMNDVVNLNARGNVVNLDGDVTLSHLSFGLSRRVSDSGWAGVFIDRSDASIDFGIGTLSGGFTSLGIEGGVKSGALDLGVFIGTDGDMTSYGLAAKFTQSSTYQLGASLMRSQIDDFDESVGLNFAGIAGVTALNKDLLLFTGLGHSSLSALDLKGTTFGMGLSYNLGGEGGYSALSLEVSHSNASFFDVDGSGTTIRLGLTIPFGGTRGFVPQNSVAGAILNPTHNALSQTILTQY